MKQYKTGLVIGRFQPFHLGHKFLFDEAFRIAEDLVIVIGSSNKKNKKNPYSYLARKKMINKFLVKEGYAKRVKKIFFSMDIPDDYKWRDIILRKAGSVNVVIGNNEMGSNKFFEETGIPIERIGLHKRHILEGSKIRKSMKLNKPWRNRVPEYLVEEIEKGSS